MTLSRSEILSRFEALLAERDFAFRPRAEEQAITDFTSTLNLDPSHLLFELYRRADGQEFGARSPLITASCDADCISDFDFLPLAEAVTLQRELTDALDNGAFSNQHNLRPDIGVAELWWNRRWVPFLSDQAGTYICVDFAPTSEGTPGQVIRFEHDSPIRRLLDKTIEAFLSNYFVRRTDP